MVFSGNSTNKPELLICRKLSMTAYVFANHYFLSSSREKVYAKEEDMIDKRIWIIMLPILC